MPPQFRIERYVYPLQIYPQRIYNVSVTAKSTPIKPLTPAVLHILLSLADGDKHGYAIIQFVSQQSKGGVTMGPGTLYGTIKRLLEVDWVAEEAERPDDDDPRRRYYRLTEQGQTALRQELKRLDGIVKIATVQGLLSAVGR